MKIIKTICKCSILDSVELTSSSNSSKNDTTSGESSDFTRSSNRPRPQQKKMEPIFSPRLLACLDKYKISNRAALHIIGAVASSFNINIENYIFNFWSLLQCRVKYRESLATSKHNDFHVILRKIHLEESFFVNFKVLYLANSRKWLSDSLGWKIVAGNNWT